MDLGPLAIASVFIAIIMFAAFYQMLRHQRRAMIHKERLTAIEKGVEPPSFELESPRRLSWNVQQFLLLAGLIWMSIGIGAFVFLQALISYQAIAPGLAVERVPLGLQFIGVAPFLIGVSHLIVYAVARKREPRD